tara:strand:+ start:404 stop:1873 length:1470 start_codon:yes stop_codon:yes gene_type:complete
MKKILIIKILFCYSLLYGESINIKINDIDEDFNRQNNLDRIYKNSFDYFQLLRNEKGIYRDALRFDGNHFHPSSVATIGMGLISLCIADRMGWISDADSLAELTLFSITGQDPDFYNPDRNSKGYYRHWIDMNTGEQAWNSEYSSIDTGILLAGALFCKNYFNFNNYNENITYYVEMLWESIDWSVSIFNPQTGGIYREFDHLGMGLINSITLPFNEYILVAWFAKNQEDAANVYGDANELWFNHYENPDSLQKKDYFGIELLTDNQNYYLSNFTYQFSYYLCNYFTLNDNYNHYLSNSRRADSLWWSIETNAQTFEWGLGAGNSLNIGYHADAINNNLDQTVSPHIISGFIPVYSEGKEHILDLYSNDFGLYEYQYTDSILWRYSLLDREGMISDISGVDFSTMLFGLSTLPDYLGPDFFPTYNHIYLQSVGDVNNDFSINILDVIEIINLIIYQDELTPDLRYFSDVNQDSVINIIDIVQLVQIIIN